MTDLQLSIHFFLQLAVILGVCRAVGWVAGKVGQPQVVGEMIAGVLIGPSLFGLLAPAWQQWLFPKPSLPLLFSVSQIGLSLYMFVVGLDFRMDLFTNRIRSAASISIAGMVVPFILGGCLAAWLVQRGGLFSPATKPVEAILFLGASMCITAFPMLARIIYERGLSGTPLGTLALAAGAMDDAAAWCILAVVLASFGNNWQIAILAVGGGVFYAVFCLTLLRKALKPLATRVDTTGKLSPALLGLILMLVMISSWITDSIGIYAVFGAFILGCAMPRGKLAVELQKTIEPFVVVFLLPLFFTFSGLRTRLDLVNEPSLLGIAVLALLAACLGKGIACWAAARLNGEDGPTSMAIGTLMNARGLMELIILNIGIQAGVILPPLFSIMVIMAVVTTLMATPIFERVYGRTARLQGNLGAAPGG